MSRYPYPTTIASGKSRFRSWAFGLAFVGLAVLFGLSQFRTLVPTQIHNQLQAQLDSWLGELELRGNLRSVDFVEGTGFRINDLKIFPAANESDKTAAPLLEIYEGFVHAAARLGDLVTGNVTPHSIDIRGAKLTVVRTENGQWNFWPLLQRLRLNETSDLPNVTVRFQESEIKIIDRTQSPPRNVTLRDIEFNFEPLIYKQQKLFQLTGSFSVLAISKFTFKAYVNPLRKTWSLTDLSADRAKLSRDLLRLLPARVSKSIEDIEMLDGEIVLRGSANGDFNGRQPIRFDVEGTIRQLTVEDRRLPLPLRQCAIDFSINQNELNISRAHGRLGQGSFELSYRQRGLFSRDQWSVAGRLYQFDFGEKLHGWLPNDCRVFCQDYRPQGTSNIDFQLTQFGQKLTRNIQAEITDMSFEYSKFPYRFEHCRGHTRWVDDDCEFEIESAEGSKRIRFSGRAKNPGPQSTYIVEVETESDFPIDDRLLAALAPFPNVKKNVMAFRPVGHISGSGSFLKNRPDLETPIRSFDVQLRNCNVQHRHFEYPISNVNGFVRIRGDRCEFDDVTGANGTAGIRCDGAWDKTSGLNLRLLCNQVPMDEKLRTALKPEIREIWSGFRPRGTVELVRVGLTLPPEAEFCNVILEADLAASSNLTDPMQQSFASTGSISIRPVWFPYEIGQLAGNVKIGNGRVSLSDMKGLHRRTWMVCQGDGVYTDAGWSVSLKDLFVGALRVDEELLTALPSSLTPAMEQLQFEGLLNVSGEITMGGEHENKPNPVALTSQVAQANYESTDTNPIDQSTAQMFWDLRFDMNQSQMQLGWPVENIFGMVQLRGEYNGQIARCSGELAIDSMTIQNAQITNVRGPIWIDEQGVAAGTLAAGKTQQSEPRQIVGQLFGGQVRFDGQKQADERGRFFIQASLTDGKLKEIVNDIAPHLQQIDGRSFGAVRLSGDDVGTHTYRGEGTLHFRDAEIYELPVILSLLKILRIKEVNRTAFDTSDVDFSINGSSIDLDRIELIGDAISLIGNGKVDFNRQIDLNFYSVMGRNRWYIPVISELYRAGSQRILWIKVDGTCDNPKTHRDVLPQLNDTIRSLLQPPNSNSNLLPAFDTTIPLIGPQPAALDGS